MNYDGQDGQDSKDGEKPKNYPFMHAALTEKILAACFEVASEMGSGFVESVYEKSLEIALHHFGLDAIRQVPLRVYFRSEFVGKFYADLVVENKVIVELKSVKALAPEHLAQAINYLNASDIEVALLVNFGMPKLEYRRIFKGKRRKKSIPMVS